MSYIRIGKEGKEIVECNSEQLLSFGINEYVHNWGFAANIDRCGYHSFIILANTFRG